VRRFDEIQHDLGIARNVLTDRLTKLVDHGVLEKRQYQDRPARYEYRLTAKGIDLSPALVALMRWGDKHLAGEDAPTVLVHDACGDTLDQTFICWTCDTAVQPTEIKSKPGRQRRAAS
jgi:DNA-binding HxlR family transcriptional regulator